MSEMEKEVVRATGKMTVQGINEKFVISAKPMELEMKIQVVVCDGIFGEDQSPLTMECTLLVEVDDDGYFVDGSEDIPELYTSPQNDKVEGMHLRSYDLNDFHFRFLAQD